MAGLWTRPVLLIMCRRHDILTCNSADAAGPRHAAELLFCIPCSTNYKHWGRDSTQQWNGTRRGIKNNKEMANCAPQPNLISSSHQLTESRQCILMIASFYRAQSWEHQSIFMIDFGVLFWLEECGPCVKCFYPRPEGLRTGIVRGSLNYL